MQTIVVFGKIPNKMLWSDSMPIYGYHCKSCKYAFEVMQSVSDKPVRSCPKCEGPVSKVFFPISIAFKGSGFHVNDYKSPKRVAAEKSAGENGSNGGCGDGDDSGGPSCTSVGTLGSDQY
ncbi:MAG: FmdB family transcriptional regulator [Actinobacteria bacterium]|nr:FmdB family transcriptional regulator [Actinomycetota bacterium]